MGVCYTNKAVSQRKSIWSGIEEVITRTTRNRLTGETVRGFESHPLRQFVASYASLAAIFLKNRRCAHFAAPHFRPRPAWLGSRARKVLPYKFSRYERRFQQNKKYPHMEVSIWGYCFYRPRFQL